MSGSGVFAQALQINYVRHTTTHVDRKEMQPAQIGMFPRTEYFAEGWEKVKW